MAPSFTRPCVLACAVTAATGLSLQQRSVLKADDDTSYPVFGAGFCSQNEADDGSRIGAWVNGQTKLDAEQACAADEACKGFHWNSQDKSYALVSQVGPLGDDTEKGEVCYQKPEAEELNRVESDEPAQLTDDQQTIAQEQGAELDKDILEMTTGKPDGRLADRIKDLVAAHPKLPSITLGSSSCFSNDGSHALAELKDLKSLTIGDGNGIEAKMLKTLTKLTSLTIGNTNSLDAGIYMALGDLTDLTSLTIGGKNRFGIETNCESADPTATVAEDASTQQALMTAGEKSSAGVEVYMPLPDKAYTDIGSIISDQLTKDPELLRISKEKKELVEKLKQLQLQEDVERLKQLQLQEDERSREEHQRASADKGVDDKRVTNQEDTGKPFEQVSETELLRKPRDFIKEEKKAFKMAKELKHVGSLMIGASNCIGVLGAKALGQLGRLQSLHIGDKNSIGVDGAAALGSLTKLTNLTIGYGNGFGKKGFEALTKLAKLTSLTIGDKNSFGVDRDEDDEQKHEHFQAQCHKAHQDDEE